MSVEVMNLIQSLSLDQQKEVLVYLDSTLGKTIPTETIEKLAEEWRAFDKDSIIVVSCPVSIHFKLHLTAVEPYASGNVRNVYDQLDIPSREVLRIKGNQLREKWENLVAKVNECAKQYRSTEKEIWEALFNFNMHLGQTLTKPRIAK